MPSSTSDRELLGRQAALQAEAGQVRPSSTWTNIWNRLPSYPDQVSGWEIYTAVLRDGVGTPEQLARWLAANGFPSLDPH